MIIGCCYFWKLLNPFTFGSSHIESIFKIPMRIWDRQHSACSLRSQLLYYVYAALMWATWVPAFGRRVASLLVAIF